MVREKYIQLEDSTGIYFIDKATGVEYRVGQAVTIKPNHSFGDGKRAFHIYDFYNTQLPIPFKPSSKENGKEFESIYCALEDGKVGNVKDTHLSNLVFRAESSLEPIQPPMHKSNNKFYYLLANM